MCTCFPRIECERVTPLGEPDVAPDVQSSIAVSSLSPWENEDNDGDGDDHDHEHDGDVKRSISVPLPNPL